MKSSTPASDRNLLNFRQLSKGLKVKQSDRTDTYILIYKCGCHLMAWFFSSLSERARLAKVHSHSHSLSVLFALIRSIQFNSTGSHDHTLSHIPHYPLLSFSPRHVPGSFLFNRFSLFGFDFGFNSIRQDSPRRSRRDW